MGVLENVLSEEIDIPSTRNHSSSRRNNSPHSPRAVEPSSSRNSTGSALVTPQTTRPDDKNKVIAAAVGATLTSLTSELIHRRRLVEHFMRGTCPLLHLPKQRRLPVIWQDGIMNFARIYLHPNPGRGLRRVVAA